MNISLFFFVFNVRTLVLGLPVKWMNEKRPVWLGGSIVEN